MTKRAILVISGTGFLAVAGLLAVKPLRLVMREFHRSTLTAAQAASDSSDTTDVPQATPARDPNFMKPQRLDAWEIIGPGGGGAFYNAAISPHDPNLVFISTDMRECFVSENGGKTWRSFNLRWTCGFVFDPKLPNRVYALASGTWRSDDRGRTWALVYPDSSTTVRYVDDEAEPTLLTFSDYAHPAEGMAAFAIDPDDSNTLYASMEGNLQTSHDAGKTWTITVRDAKAQTLWVDPTSPRQQRVILTRFGNGFGRWEGGKYTYHPVTGFGDFYGVAVAIPTGGKPIIYVACDFQRKDNQFTGGGIMASSDGGFTWRSLNDGIFKLVAKNSYPEFKGLSVSFKHPDVIYASYFHLNVPNDQKQYYGVMKSSDGGATWSLVRQESNVTAANMHNDWTTLRYGPDWAEEPLTISVDDNNPDIVYTGDLARVMRTTDGGKNWYGVATQASGNGWATTGLDNTTCYGIHFDPFDPKRMFISYTDIGLFRSEDGGQSWVSGTTKGVPRAWEANTYWMEFDPEVKGKVWAVMTRQHDIPRTRELNHWNGAAGGLVTSTDGGVTWTTNSKGLPPTLTPTHILLDPRSPANARVLYIAAFGRGIYKSTDSGQTWVLKTSGLPDKAPPLTFRMALASDGTLYVVTIRRSIDGNFGNDNDGWLFRSKNGGESFERVPLPEGVNGPVGVNVDPKDPARIYVAAWARTKQYVSDPLPPAGGVYMSPDGGAHWQWVLNYSRRINDVTIDPRNPDLVYAVGFEASAWRSVDRGKTWSRIGGFNFKDGQRIIPDPADINKIYITTFGNSVWHGPAAGDPKAVEDIKNAPAPMTFQYIRK